MIERQNGVHNRYVQSALAQSEPLEPLEPLHSTPTGDGAERVRTAFQRHFDCVWRYLKRIGLNDADADDGAQQAFMVLSRKIDRVAVGKERAYLCRTAHRVAADMRKKAHRRHEQNDDDSVEEPGRESLNPENLTGQRAAREMLDHVLLQLPIDLRTVFVLFEIEEFSTDQIADTLELATGTVASRLRRAREKFQAIVSRIERQNESRGGA